MGVIFDLDLTLIDTSIAENHRKKRNWKTVYNMIPSFKIYPGILESLKFLKENQIPVCIVTSSPGSYCKKITDHWGIFNNFCIGYHDTINKKPNPEPILKALSLIKTQKSVTLSFGDKDIDIIGSNLAGVISVACFWGCENSETLIKSNPMFSLKSSNELLPFIEKIFGKI